MGMFNSIFADLMCPAKKEISKDTEIQFKWQEHGSRGFGSYRLGDYLENLEQEYNNQWVRTEYICEVCSGRKQTKDGGSLIPIDGQQWHNVFVRIDESKISEILTEEEFLKRGIKDFVKDEQV